MYSISGIGTIRENLWFTSDTLFWNRECLRYFKRPFDYVEDMNEHIISQWNRVVKPKDIIYHLGNFSTGSKNQTKQILNRLNGRINLIVGSEDSNSNVLSMRNKLASCNYRLEITVNHYLLTLNHYPQRRWNNDHQTNSFMLHGFTGHTLPPEFGKLTLDVGVDGFDFTPLHFDRVVEIMDQKRDHFEFKTNQQSFYL